MTGRKVNRELLDLARGVVVFFFLFFLLLLVLLVLGFVFVFLVFLFLFFVLLFVFFFLVDQFGDERGLGPRGLHFGVFGGDEIEILVIGVFVGLRLGVAHRRAARPLAGRRSARRRSRRGRPGVDRHRP